MGLLLLPLVLAVLQKLHLAVAQDDEFEYFRCDACRATFFKVNKTIVERYGSRRATMPTFEFVEVLEELCETAFTKEEYGVKQHEGRKYLFGPGIEDHIPNQGFGQMGMGDYDKRLQSYCRMFVEDVGEEELHRLFQEERAVDKTKLCRAECTSSASGTGALSSEPRRPKGLAVVPLPAGPEPPPASPAASRLATPRRKAKSRRTSPAPAEQRREPSDDVARRRAASVTSPAAGSPAVEEMVQALPQLSALQLRWLGEAVLSELARRAPTGPSGGAAAGALGSVEL